MGVSFSTDKKKKEEDDYFSGFVAPDRRGDDGKRLSDEDYKSKTDERKNELAKQVAEQDKKEEEKRKEAERQAKIKLGGGHGSIWEKIGDAFEANSPQDKAKREAKGMPTLYQDYKKENKQREEKAKSFDLSEEEVAQRKDFFNRGGVDLEKYLKLKDSDYAKVHEGTKKGFWDDTIFGKKESKLKDVDLKAMAEKAEKEGLFDNNEEAKKDMETARQLEAQGSKSNRNFYAQAIMKGTPELSKKSELEKIEGQYQTKLKQDSGAENNILQKFGRNMAGGYVESFTQLPSNAQSLASNALDVVSPEGSRLDKFAQERFDDAARDNAGVKQEVIDKGVGQQEEDGFWGNLGRGAGSLGAAATVGPGGGAKAGKSIWSTVKAFAKPSVVGTMFGVNKGGDIVRESRASGSSAGEAMVQSAVAGYAEGVLENYGLSKMFGRFGTGRLVGLVGGAVTEGSQEFVQDMSTSVVQSTYKDVNWGEAIGQAWQSAQIGGILGGSAGVVTGGAEEGGTLQQELSKNFQEQGLTPEDAEKTAEDYVLKIGMKLEEVGQTAEDIDPNDTPEEVAQPEDTGVMNVKPPEVGPSEVPGANITVTEEPVGPVGPIEDTTGPESEGPSDIVLPEKVFSEEETKAKFKFPAVTVYDREGNLEYYVPKTKEESDYYNDLIDSGEIGVAGMEDSNGKIWHIKSTDLPNIEAVGYKEIPNLPESDIVDPYKPAVPPKGTVKKLGVKKDEGYGDVAKRMSTIKGYLDYYKESHANISENGLKNFIDANQPKGFTAEAILQEYNKTATPEIEPAPQVGKTKGTIKPLSKKKADYEIKYPNKTTELPKTLKANAEKAKEETPGGKEDELNKRQAELTVKLDKEGYVTNNSGASLRFTRADIKTIVDLAPGLKESPIGVIKKEDGITWLTWKTDKTDGKINLNVMGISDERIQTMGLKDGDTIDFGRASTDKGKVPVVKNNTTGIEAFTDVEAKTGGRFESEVARTPAELEKIIDQINWVGQKNAILRRGGLKSKKNAGVFQHPRNKGTDRDGVVKLKDDVLLDARKYVTVMSHELAHAIENQINGNNTSTYDLFGELTKEERKTIEAELIAIVNNLEGEAVASNKPGYYYKPTEMFARLIETLILEPGSAQLAPTAMAKLEDLTVTNPKIAELIQVVQDKMPDDHKPKVWSVWRDMRQTFQQHLGVSLGDIAYNAELVRRAMSQKHKEDIEITMNKLFKGVKDGQDVLFETAESILEMTEDGEIVFGTSDRWKTTDKKEADKMIKLNGFTLDQVLQDDQGNAIYQLSKLRYTPEQGRRLYDSLSPEGQNLMKEYVKKVDAETTLFNRNQYREYFEIEESVEGWVHRGVKDTNKGRMNLLNRRSLREKKASASKRRDVTNSTTRKDFRMQMEKALLDAGETQINNRFIGKQLARISKPIAKGMSPDAGWEEVNWDPKKGMTLIGENGRDRVTITTIDEWGESDTNSFLKPQNRYQVPKGLAKYYRNMREVVDEVTTTERIMKNLAKYWAINVLTSGSTTGTNVVGGAIQMSAHIVDDMFADALSPVVTGKAPNMRQTKENIKSLVTVLTPKNWRETKTYQYGGSRTNFAGQLIGQSFTETKIDQVGNFMLKPFSLVEDYFKKVTLLAEGSTVQEPAGLKATMTELSEMEAAILGEANKVIDRTGLDYDNVPFWMQSFSKKGVLIKPFIKYPYKYSKMLTHYATGVFDTSLPTNERIAKLMTLAFFAAAILAADDWRDKETETPQGSEETPSSLNPRGRLNIGKWAGEELFVRTAKYPFWNVTTVGKALVQGDFGEARDIVADQIGTVGPVAKIAMVALGYKNEFETYTDPQVIYAQTLGTFIPGFRVLNDIGKLVDDKPRLPATFTQGLLQNIPIPGSEDTKAKYRGKPKTLDIPIEPETRTISENPGTETRGRKWNPTDVLISALTGVYITRINPDEAKNQALRDHRNTVEKDVRELLKKHKWSEAEDMAGDAGLTISKGSREHYVREYNSDGTKKE